MLNEEFMTPQEKQICQLKLEIKSFKEYDEKRKKLMHKLQDDLEEYSQKYLDLKHILDNLPDGSAIAEFQQKIAAQRKELARLNSIVSLIPDEKLQVIQKAIDETKENKDFDKLKKLNMQYEKDIIALRSANSQLAIQNSRLKQQLTELQQLATNVTNKFNKVINKQNETPNQNKETE